MKKTYKLWDGIECELIDVDSPQEAKEILIKNYTDGNTAHPDILSCELMEVVKLPHPLKEQLTD